jgi:SAM-dependent methyltransferase
MASEDTTESRQRDSAERFDPVEMGGGLMEAEHRARYWWATQWVAGKEVLDAGCGVGYGTSMLAEHGPARLVGVDISADALARAPEDRLELVEADLRELPFEADSFDLVVCFEVIEHIEDHERVVDELRRVLRPDGALLISSPNRDVYAPGNPHHVHEFLPDELRETLCRRFDHVDLHGQHVLLASAIVSDEGLGARQPRRFQAASIEALAPGMETYTLAVAGDAPSPAQDGVISLGDAFEVRWWQERLEDAQARLARVTREAHEARNAESELRRRVLDLEQQVARVRQLEHDVDLANRGFREMAAESAVRGQIIEDLKSSLSWKLTAPLRAAKRLLK